MGVLVGLALGFLEGLRVGAVGVKVGLAVGVLVGTAEGDDEGFVVGDLEQLLQYVQYATEPHFWHPTHALPPHRPFVLPGGGVTPGSQGW